LTFERAFKPPKLTDKDFIDSNFSTLTGVDSRHTGTNSGNYLVIYTP
jgi:hypothetical protein